ncbi:MAG: PIN domain-containing protein, partial [Lachnospiraceae bacterium]|nr:PIN domain-containing protein [Lachnospiraceae bacterium]
MKYHYLIDYENVHEEGLTGLNTIEDDAVIHIFYSDRARKLDLDSFREGQILQIEALKVPVGKQSLDMQLVSYMGYLMGRERGEGNKYIIISKDNGYLNSIPFWSQIMRDGTTVEVRPQIRPTAVEIPSQKQKKQPTAQKTEKQVFPKKYEKQTISLKSEKPASAQKKEKPEAEQPEENLTTVEEALQTAPQMTEKNERRTKGKGRSRSRREKNQESNSSRFTDRVTAAAAAVKNILIDTPNADEAKPQTEDVTSQVQTNAAAESQLQIEPDAESLTQTAEAAAPSQLPIEPASESLTQMAEASAPSQLPIEPASESLTQATEAAAPSQLPT